MSGSNKGTFVSHLTGGEVRCTVLGDSWNTPAGKTGVLPDGGNEAVWVDSSTVTRDDARS